MRIVVNDIAAETGGALEILNQFYRHVRERDDENEWIFLLSAPYLEETENIKVVLVPACKQGKLKKLAFDLFRGKKLINRLQPDAVLSLQNILTFGVKAPQYVYIHQSIPYQTVRNFSLLKRAERGVAVYQHVIGRLIHRSAKKADGVIVQAEWMRDAVARKTKIKKDKILVARPDIPHLGGEAQGDLDGKRFFYPTADAIYKNNETVVAACNLLNERGLTDFTVKLTLKQGAIEHPNIECVGYLNKEQLKEEYANSTLLFPSYIETIGLPLLEARQFGVPILASNAPNCTELLQDYQNVKFFPPFSPSQLADQMEEIIRNGASRGKVENDNPLTSQWEYVYQYVCRQN